MYNINYKYAHVYKVVNEISAVFAEIQELITIAQKRKHPVVKCPTMTCKKMNGLGPKTRQLEHEKVPLGEKMF